MAATQNEAIAFSIPLPHSIDTRLYIRICTQARAVVLSLTTAGLDELATPRPMGSFVYALPNVWTADSVPLFRLMFHHSSCSNNKGLPSSWLIIRTGSVSMTSNPLQQRCSLPNPMSNSLLDWRSC